MFEIDPKKLMYFAAVIEHGSLNRAAKVLKVSQPALSTSIAKLERELSVTLIHRGQNFEGLTPEGELALAHGHRMLHEAESLRQALASRAGAPTGVLQIGVVPSAEPLAARFAARLQALHPGIRPVLRSLSSPEIEAGLDGLSIDLGLGYFKADLPSFFNAQNFLSLQLHAPAGSRRHEGRR